MKQSGIVITIGPRTWQWLWSSWGWSVKHNGRWITDVDRTPMKYRAKHEAMKVAKLREQSEWLDDQTAQGYGAEPYQYVVSVEPYPGKLVQS